MLKVENKILSIIIFLILVLIFGGCAENKLHFSHEPINISYSDSLEVMNRLKTGQWLTRYDDYILIATDSLLQDKKLLNEFRGYYFYYNDENIDKVIFGNCTDSTFEKLMEVEFKSDDLTICNKFIPPKNVGSKFLNWAKIVTHSKKLNSDHMQKLDCKFSYYIKEDKDTITCYWIPESTEEYLIFCGGIKTIYNKSTLNMIDNILLHKSVIKYPRTDYGNAILYSMNLAVTDSLPNEVDFAHLYLKRNLLKRQNIITKKFTTMLSFDNPDKILKITYYENKSLKMTTSKSDYNLDYIVVFDINLDKKFEFESASLAGVYDVVTKKEVNIEPSKKFMESANEIFVKKKWTSGDFKIARIKILFMSKDNPDVALESK